jgi:hypothetical protein
LFAFAAIQRCQHALLDRCDGRGCRAQAGSSPGREGVSLAAAVAEDAHESGGVESGEELVHRLSADERIAREFRVLDARSRGEQLEAGVLRHAEFVVAQLHVHR